MADDEKPAKPLPVDSLAVRIATLRAAAGLTVEAAAAAAGITEAMWEALEEGEMHPRLWMLRPLARILGVSIYDIS